MLGLSGVKLEGEERDGEDREGVRTIEESSTEDGGRFCRHFDGD